MDDESFSFNTLDFLRTLYGNVDSGVIEVTYLAPDGVRVYPNVLVQWADLPLNRDIDPEFPVIRRNNLKGYGVYFGVAVRNESKPPEERISKKTGKPYTFYPRGHQTDARCITALWVDVDAKDGGTLDNLFRPGLLPSIIVSSGGGWHGYWLLKEPLMITDENRAMVHRTLKGLAIACKADTSVADLARILRLPGTVNTKPGRGGVMCEVIGHFPDLYYHYAQMEVLFSPLAAPKTPQVTRDIPIEASAGLPGWVLRYLQYGAVEGERNKRLFAAAVEYKANGYPIFQAENELGGRASADGLGDEEIKRTINSAYASGMGTPNLPKRDHLMIAANDKLLDAKRKLRGA